MRRTMAARRRWLGRLAGVAGGLAALTMLAGTALAVDVPPNWHVHDGQLALGPEHKGIGFFPVILGQTLTEYQADPARCPNATDKAFLPGFDTRASDLLRAGVCMTSDRIIHLRTVPLGTDGPAGWSSLTTPTEPGWITYYRVTSR
ncbi:MAG TPA: hypothetical protein VNJ28_08155 [Candidatus Limnocylindrales bacterium]|nr:hypothetical protein [Candidatus Limnocylindrales bacterium]